MNNASNTSGAEVANVGFWPRAVLPKIVDYLASLGASIKAVASGTADPATVDFSASAGSDKISDAAMAEITRRLVVTVERDNPNNVLFQPTEPDDHTKSWWKTDPVSGIPIGQPLIWSDEQGKWVSTTASQQTYVPPATRSGTIMAAAGTSTANFEFTDILTTNYSVTLTPTTFINGAWAPAPVSFPTHFGALVVNKTNTLVSVNFYGVPTGGVMWEIDITSRV